MTHQIAAIVEGHGEVSAVPILVRRIATEVNPSMYVKVDPVFRVPAAKLIKPSEFERYVELAARKLRGTGAILVIIDCDWPGCCPAECGPKLLERGKAVRSDVPISVIFAKKEFESWFLASAESLSGKRGLSADIQSPPQPEEVRGAKEWLSRYMPPHQPYAETTDQAAFADLFDMQMAAQRSDSFDKCYRDITTLLRLLER